MRFLLIITLALVACSTRNEKVGKNLPNVSLGQQKPTSEVGSTGVPDSEAVQMGHSFSAFLWPIRPAQKSLADLAAEIASDSREIDKLTKQYRDWLTRVGRESTLWTTFRCLPADEISAEDKAAIEKDLVDLKDNREELRKKHPIEDCERKIVEEGAAAACRCLSKNKLLIPEEAMYVLKKRVGLGEKIVMGIENDLDGMQNWLLGGTVPGSAVGSNLKIAKGDNGYDVTLRLEGFHTEGMVYRTIKIEPTAEIDQCGIPKDTSANSKGRILMASYSDKTNLLTFMIPEKVDGVETGNRYEFSMERGYVKDGAPEFARFSGDLVKKDCSGKIVGVGSAKFDGAWSF